MKFGMAFANIGPFVQPDEAVFLAQAAEEAGIESIWTVEHVAVPAGYQAQYPYSADGKMPGPENSPIPDPLVWLAYVAAATSTIRLATGILILPQRHPIYVAYAAVLLGEFLWFGHTTLLVYVGLYLPAAQAVIVLWEEPVLRQRFGEDYSHYTREVRRWL